LQMSKLSYTPYAPVALEDGNTVQGLLG
jgi:hypothetical protein